jgi:hypothetical protein
MRPYGKTAGSLVKSHAARKPHLMAPFRAAAVGLALTLALLSPARALPAPASPAGAAPPDGLIAVCVDGNLWTDGGFEGTTTALANPNYLTTSLKFGFGPSTPNGTPLCNIGNLSCQDGTGAPPASNSPRTGNSWAWFGGNDGFPTALPEEVASAEQTITFPSGASSVTLNFYLRIGVVTSPFTDTLEVQVDGVTQQTYTEPSVAEANYTLRSIDLSAFANGAAHAVKFLYTQHGNTGVVNTANFDVDDVTLDIACASLTPTALAVDSSGNGVLEPGEIATVEPTWKNNSGAQIFLTGESSNFTGPSGPAYTNADFSADYGAIGAGASKECTDCYTVQATAVTRPAPHWDTTIDDDAGAAAKTWTLHVGDSFADVPHDAYYPFIETIWHYQITAGCPTGYCPNGFTKRSQMAVFLLKAKEGSGYVPPAAVGIFTDVAQNDPFAPWIEELYNRGITAGCSAVPLMYCPNEDVPRDQMAVFLLKTKDTSAYAPPACASIFTDVPCPSLYANFIEELYNRGITAGCDTNKYCPADLNTRAQMAVFLTKTFGLVLYGP